MLQWFYRIGMTELSFIIVNAKDPLSQLMISHLERRVSNIPVYQERLDENIWNVLQGGKDDMFVFDRCGRLTYYIPFPLSLIYPKGSIVQAAVQSTYYDEPCTVSCENFTNGLPNILIDYSNGTLLEIENGDSTVALNDTENQDFNGTETVANMSSNITIDSSYIELMNENETDIENTSIPIQSWNILKFVPGSAGEDLTHAEDNNTVHNRSHGRSGHGHGHGHGGHHKKRPEGHKDSEDLSSGHHSRTPHHGHAGHHPRPHDAAVSRQVYEFGENSVFCPGITEKTCSEYSRHELERAHECCVTFLSSNHHNRQSHSPQEDHSSAQHRHRGGCRHFSRKKCKKLQPLVKCCLKAGSTSTRAHDDSEAKSSDLDHHSTKDT